MAPPPQSSSPVTPSTTLPTTPEPTPAASKIEPAPARPPCQPTASTPAPAAVPAPPGTPPPPATANLRPAVFVTPLASDPFLRRAAPQLTPALRDMIRAMGPGHATPLLSGPDAVATDGARAAPDLAGLFTPTLRDMYLGNTLDSPDGMFDVDRVAEMQALFSACVPGAVTPGLDAFGPAPALSLLSSPEPRGPGSYPDSGSAGTAAGSSVSGASISPQADAAALATRPAPMPETAMQDNGKRRRAAPIAAAPPRSMPSMIPLPVPAGVAPRPLAWVNSAHGPALVPVDVLAQAGYAVLAAPARAPLRQSEPAGGPTPRPTVSPAAPAGGSRKRRRRMAAGDGPVSDEEARANRAKAMIRLKEKKSVRSYEKTVRYACRKKIAMVRPRVNGRFATKEEVEQFQRTGRFIA